MEERERTREEETLRRVHREARTHGYRAALEAVFTPTPLPCVPCGPVTPPARSSARLVSPSSPTGALAGLAPADDPKRRRLLARLLEAEGPSAVTRAADELFAAGYSAPHDLETGVKLLEHVDEARVLEALKTLDALLALRPPARKTVLEGRLRRLEDSAEDASVRELAARLRRRLGGSTLLLG